MEYIVHKKIALHARPSEVWDALTNPEKTKKYFFNCKVFSDWKAGSPIVFKGKMFWVFKIEMHGVIEQIEPEKLLQYILKNESGDAETFSRVTDRLVFENGKTTLEITDDVGQGEGAEKRFRKSQKGWDKILDGLQNLLPKTDTT
jgi:uncharacterized protein YndB with AHSA1/START domain